MGAVRLPKILVLTIDGFVSAQSELLVDEQLAVVRRPRALDSQGYCAAPRPIV